MRLVLFVFLAMIVSACASPAQQHLELLYPEPCKVERIQNSYFAEVFRVSCPGEEPHTEKYYKK